MSESDSISVTCLCGSVVLGLSGKSLIQAYCHCDDCQAAHGAAYVMTAAYPASAVEVQAGQIVPLVIERTSRMRCADCGMLLFTEVTSANLRSVNAKLLPNGAFQPQFHLQCQHAVLPVVDDLPHYKDFPASFGGSNELVEW